MAAQKVSTPSAQRTPLPPIWYDYEGPGVGRARQVHRVRPPGHHAAHLLLCRIARWRDGRPIALCQKELDQS